MIAVGILAGVATALMLGRVAKAQLYGIAATDLLSFGVVVIVVLFVMLVACVIPATRAMRIDPMLALKQD